MSVSTQRGLRSALSLCGGAEARRMGLGMGLGDADAELGRSVDAAGGRLAFEMSLLPSSVPYIPLLHNFAWAAAWFAI